MDADEVIEDSTRFWLTEQMRNRLRELRREAGMTQTEVGHELGKDQVFVSNCESGRRRIDPVELMAFLKVYDGDIHEFYKDLDFEEAKEREYRP